MTHAEAQSGGGDEPDDPLLDEIVDERFRIDELLGQGAVGRVYRAKQLSVGRDVAMKVLRGDFRHDPEYKERFFREARVISGFNHPNIVRLVDFGEDEVHDFAYLAMEMVEGIELAELVDYGRLEPALAVETAYQASAALIEAHREQIIHRDLKADNFFLVPMTTGAVQAKVLDFGVAFPQDSDTRLTREGEIFGTPAYMSPEQGQGQDLDPRTDLYSLGVILFEMLTGRLPFEADSTIEMMVKQVQEEPPAPSDCVSVSLPSGIDALVGDLLAKDPDDRPDDGKAVRDRIEGIRSHADLPPPEVDTSRRSDEAFVELVADEAGAGDDGAEGGDYDVQSEAEPEQEVPEGGFDEQATTVLDRRKLEEKSDIDTGADATEPVETTDSGASATGTDTDETPAASRSTTDETPAVDVPSQRTRTSKDSGPRDTQKQQQSEGSSSEIEAKALKAVGALLLLTLLTGAAIVAVQYNRSSGSDENVSTEKTVTASEESAAPKEVAAGETSEKKVGGEETAGGTGTVGEAEKSDRAASEDAGRSGESKEGAATGGEEAASASAERDEEEPEADEKPESDEPGARSAEEGTSSTAESEPEATSETTSERTGAGETGRTGGGAGGGSDDPDPASGSAPEPESEEDSVSEEEVTEELESGWGDSEPEQKKKKNDSVDDELDWLD